MLNKSRLMDGQMLFISHLDIILTMLKQFFQCYLMTFIVGWRSGERTDGSTRSRTFMMWAQSSQWYPLELKSTALIVISLSSRWQCGWPAAQNSHRTSRQSKRSRISIGLWRKAQHQHHYCSHGFPDLRRRGGKLRRRNSSWNLRDMSTWGRTLPSRLLIWLTFYWRKGLAIKKLSVWVFVQVSIFERNHLMCFF